MDRKCGRWTIIGEKRKSGKKYYECRCDCGTVKDVYYQSIENGESQSCGCLRRELTMRNMMNDLTGQRFGKLVVIERDWSKNHVYWICECDCGNRKSIKGTSLTRKKEPSRSCGCDQRKIAAKTGARTVADNSRVQIETNMKYHTNFQVIGKKEPGKNNKSGHKGVWWDANRGKWCAYIQVHGERVFLGRFWEKEDAIKARELAEEEYFSPLLEKLEDEHERITE